jgi:hypothetical protein
LITWSDKALPYQESPVDLSARKPHETFREQNQIDIFASYGTQWICLLFIHLESGPRSRRGEFGLAKPEVNTYNHKQTHCFAIFLDSAKV